MFSPRCAMTSVVVLTVLAGVRGDEDPAIAAARARQQAVTSLSVEYTVKEVIEKGGCFPLTANPQKPIPAQQTVLESKNRLIIDGRKFRFEDNHIVIQEMSGHLHLNSAVTVSDGQIHKVLRPQATIAN